jgi:hypothetical protein
VSPHTDAQTHETDKTTEHTRRNVISVEMRDTWTLIACVLVLIGIATSILAIVITAPPS